ncbi:MAG: YihY/virulence factor BrkB family protein [Bacteroidales bacterium]|nr:YihY/virulence factor BrkB family protein [Porphyromonas sp.]MDD6934600.1 YihY/virulence factor BrkB family protein [Bacteroidales bacterium]MDY3101810.1 YihY/virulence factor BrkB family protein [Porphyromonas sp.]
MAKKSKFQRFIRKCRILMIQFVEFVSMDMWHIDKDEVFGLRRIGINALKSLYMAVKGFIQGDLQSRASALTYSTVLAIVPMLAVLVGIAKGFGVQDTLSRFLLDYFPTHTDEITKSLHFVENYLSRVKGGLFLGIGLIFLLYTVFNLLSTIENVFNRIWETTKGRTFKDKVTSYFTMIFLLPVMITVSSGITLTMTTIQNSFMKDFVILGSMTTFLLKLVPFVLIVFTFVAIFMALPNVKVRFVPALLSGLLAGASFHLFQMLYINGMLWISTYNAIYGGFAAFPLLLLWMQLTWIITLFCAKLCYAIQNVNKFTYEKEVTRVSRRYSDFLTVLIMAHIVQRFVDPKHLAPYTVEQLADQCRIPVKLTTMIIRQLLALRLIVEVKNTKQSKTGNYYPAVDPETLSVGSLIARLDSFGSENFKVDKNKYMKEWDLTIASREALVDGSTAVLLKNLPLGRMIASKG